MVFEKTYTVDSEQEYDTEHEQSPVDEPGKYVVHATTDSGMEAEIETTRHVEDENECIGVHFEVVSETEIDAWTRSKCLSESLEAAGESPASEKSTRRLTEPLI